VAGVGAVGLRVPLLASPCVYLGRLGKVGSRARLGKRLTDKQPARASLDRDLDPLVGEALDPGTDSARGRLAPSAGELARLGVERVEGDLGSVHVESGYERHSGLL
jgi:hypothetical protein